MSVQNEIKKLKVRFLAFEVGVILEEVEGGFYLFDAAMMSVWALTTIRGRWKMLWISASSRKSSSGQEYLWLDVGRYFCSRRSPPCAGFFIGEICYPKIVSIWASGRCLSEINYRYANCRCANIK